MKHVVLLALMAVVLAASGCAKVVGPYYLEQEEYHQGIEVLGEQFREHPDDASSAYYLGRYHLALNEPEKGLDYLQKAMALDPENADYAFWSGVAWWALLDSDKERQAYLKALKLDPDHISANLYLGHGYVDEGEWDLALARYDKVLELDKYNPEALFNRAVALSNLKRHREEIAAWKKFLEYYPSGSMAMQATERLNLHGNFSYRNFILGKRNVTLKSVTFKQGTSEMDGDSRDSLHVINAMMRRNPGLALHIVAYAKGDASLAKARAQAVRDYMLGGNPGFDPNRLPLSWFGTPEEIELNGVTHSLDDSVQFITVTR